MTHETTFQPPWHVQYDLSMHNHTWCHWSSKVIPLSTGISFQKNISVLTFDLLHVIHIESLLGSVPSRPHLISTNPVISSKRTVHSATQGSRRHSYHFFCHVWNLIIFISCTSHAISKLKLHVGWYFVWGWKPELGLLSGIGILIAWDAFFVSLHWRWNNISIFCLKNFLLIGRHNNFLLDEKATKRQYKQTFLVVRKIVMERGAFLRALTTWATGMRWI